MEHYDPQQNNITVTPEAASWIVTQLESRGKGLGVRLGTKPSGCTGYKYIVEFADEFQDTDFVFAQHDVKIYIDPKSMLMLNGMTIDYATEGLNSGLKFVNPNVTGECGCGESFAV